MSSVKCQKQLKFLSNEQKAELNKKFSERTTAMPHELAVRLGITYAEALTIIALLEADGLCQNQLLIYHNCDPDVLLDAIPYGIGFPNLPWTCPECKEEVESYDELSFDIMAIASEAIEFI